MQKKNIDILVNAAGVTHYSLLMATDAHVIEDVVRTNLVGCIYGCKAVLKNMIRQKGGTILKPASIGHYRSLTLPGCIINISSAMGLKGGRGSAAYAASKAGVLGNFHHYPSLIHHSYVC